MDDLIKELFSGFGGATLIAIWALARHTPGSEAQLNFYLMCFVTFLWVGRAICEFLQHRGEQGALRRLLFSNVLPATCVAALFVYPYQYPTAYPLHAELRADLRGANRLVLYNSLRTYPDDGFAEPLANLRGLNVTPQRSNVYHRTWKIEATCPSAHSL